MSLSRKIFFMATISSFLTNNNSLKFHPDCLEKTHKEQNPLDAYPIQLAIAAPSFPNWGTSTMSPKKIMRKHKSEIFKLICCLLIPAKYAASTVVMEKIMTPGNNIINGGTVPEKLLPKIKGIKNGLT